MENFDWQALSQYWALYPQQIVLAGVVLAVLLLILLRVLLRKPGKGSVAEDLPTPLTEASPEPPSVVGDVETPVSAEIEPDVVAPKAVAEPAVEPVDGPVVELFTEEKPPALSLTQRFKRGLSRTSQNFSQLFDGAQVVDDELLEDLEMQLLMADVGVDVTQQVLDLLAEKVKKQKLTDPQALTDVLKELLLQIIEPCEQPFSLAEQQPTVVMVVGVNGVGKTTTIGKLAHYYQQAGQSVMLAAGDTFRAAAVEQLQVWGEKNQVPVVAQHTGADSASVIFDAIESGKAKQVDLVLADTAGRLHNKSNLMEELTKIKRVAGKQDPTAPHEVLLVLDAGTGQNALAQMEQFSKAVGVTGIVLTKLDGTAKGGVIFPLCQKFQVPVRYIGLGEGADDLQPFDAKVFIDAMFESDK